MSLRPLRFATARYIYVFLSVFLYIYLYISIYRYLSIYIYLSISIYLYLYRSINIYVIIFSFCNSEKEVSSAFAIRPWSIYIYVYICTSIYLSISIYLPIYVYLSIDLYLYLSIYLSVCAITVSFCSSENNLSSAFAIRPWSRVD